MRKFQVSAFVLAIALGAAPAMADNTHAKAHGSKASPSERGKVSGTVESIDAAAHTIEIKTADGVKKLNLTDKTKVHKEGAAATIADVTKGTKVTAVRYDKKTNNVVRIEL